MADGVLTSSLEWTLCILFFGMQALPKNRGACVDNWFWQYTEWKGFQHEKVSYRRVEQLWCLGYRHSTSSQWPKLYSEWQNLMFWVFFQPITPSIWPQMKECAKGIVFVSSRQLILICKSSQSEFICKSYSQYGLDRPETKMLRLTPDTRWWVADAKREQFGLQDGL